MFRTVFRNAALAVAGGAMAAATLTGPAAAATPAADDTRGYHHDRDRDRHRGQVNGVTTAPLHIREAPTLDSRVIGTLPAGKRVHVLCRTLADRVGNTNEWYLLSNGYYAWASAHYIKVRHTPEWC
ncbi:hypothetical protein GCM10009716_08470 [Streptomyces sodiiphilus]|uniref:SH3b domain-containing protein n=1 Tax=Streptomyces sodiiphilus TaxID=226217 RepID=A0ABP5A2G5_9ACTN